MLLENRPDIADKIRTIYRLGTRDRPGNARLAAHWRGEELTAWERISAHCADCQNLFVDRQDPDCDNWECSLYPVHRALLQLQRRRSISRPPRR